VRSLPASLQSKLLQQIQTVHNDADPRMEVVVARARAEVVDYTYWTVETIRETSGLGDISVAPRRFRPYGPPNRIYEIHVHNGEVKTAIREYPDRLKDGWKDQFSLGAGSSVAIAFNGEWQRHRKLFRLVTEEKPYVSWVDGNGDLWVQKWDEHDTKFQLSSGVSKVRMIRAWKNTAIHYLDQGIVVAYIKTDGKVYYRNYCIQEDYTEVWEPEKELTDFTGTAVNVNLFITNDYRMGFVIEDSMGQVHWLVTPRNWGGMASPAEHLATSITDITFEVVPITYHDTHNDEHIETGITDVWFNVAEPIYPEVLSISNDDEYTIRIKFSHIIDYDLSTVGQAFSVKDSLNTTFAIVSTSAGVDNSELVLTLVNFNGASGNMFVTYDRTVVELDCLNQGSRFAIDSFTYEFTPELTPPEGFAEENLEVAVVDIMFNVQQVHYSNAYDGGENLETSIADISFVVTKVGHDPL
jgi:hypothetical protein